jgi:hypothetical protein
MKLDWPEPRPELPRSKAREWIDVIGESAEEARQADSSETCNHVRLLIGSLTVRRFPLRG